MYDGLPSKTSAYLLKRNFFHGFGIWAELLAPQIENYLRINGHAVGKQRMDTKPQRIAEKNCNTIPVHIQLL